MKMVPYQRGEEVQILDLFEASFRRKLPLEYWRWRFQEAPAGPGVIVLAWDGARLAGHYAVTPVTLSVAGRDVATGLSGTTMTHPDYRGGGLFPQLARATYEEMVRRGMGIVWGFPNTVSHRGFVRDLAWVDLYEVPMFRVRLPLSRPVPSPTEVSEVDQIDATFDELWQTVRGQYQVIAVRDRACLEWRYRKNPAEHYRILVLRPADELLGYAVLKRYEEEIHIIDLLSISDQHGLALVHATLDRAQREAAASVSLWLGVHRPLHLELEKLGFLNDAPVTYVGGRVLDETTEAILKDFRGWYLTMGDSDVY